MTFRAGKTISRALKMTFHAGKTILRASKMTFRAGKSIFRALKMTFLLRKSIFEPFSSFPVEENRIRDHSGDFPEGKPPDVPFPFSFPFERPVEKIIVVRWQQRLWTIPIRPNRAAARQR